VTGIELRAVPWLPVAGGTALGLGALALDRWVVPSGPGTFLLWLGLASIASAAGFVYDEPAAAVVDAAPRSRRWRTVRRLAIGLLPLAAWLAAAAAVARSSPLSWPALAVTGSGVVLVTLAAAAGLRRLGQDTPGEAVAAGVGGGVLVAALVAVPKVGPVLEAGDVSSRGSVWWAALSAAATVVIVWGAADPLRSGGGPGRTSG
jgi:hypothetical protein